MDEQQENTLAVGAIWHGSFPKTYWQHFNLLELPSDQVATLKPKTLGRWLGEEQNGRKLVLPVSLELSREDLISDALAVLKPLLARSVESVLMLQVKNSDRPTQANLEALRKTISSYKKENATIAVSANGLWSLEQVCTIAEEQGCLAVADPLDDELDEIQTECEFYYRVLGRRGFQNQLTDHEMHRILSRVQEGALYLSFGLKGLWSDALRFNRMLQTEDDFWS